MTDTGSVPSAPAPVTPLPVDRLVDGFGRIHTDLRVSVTETRAFG